MELIVAGIDGKENRFYCHCPPKPTGNVIFFVGDTQDLQSVMEAQYHDISQWSTWSIERTCDILKERFPTSAVWIIRPHTLLRHLFSCYHNFVESSLVGVPRFSTQPKAIPHLSQLMYNATQVLCETAQLDSHTFYHLPLTLIGFSKGCVVPNQIIYELSNYVSTNEMPPSDKKIEDNRKPEERCELEKESSSKIEKGSTSEIQENRSMETKEESSKTEESFKEEPEASNKIKLDSNKTNEANGKTEERIKVEQEASNETEQDGDKEKLQTFVHQIKVLYFLDSGHSGEFGCWVTDREVLKSLAVLNPEVHIHVTPYQMKYPQRLWIADEEIQFVSTLHELGLSTVRETNHFDDEPRSFVNHFKILNLF